MKKPTFAKSAQDKFISIYLKDEFELIDYLAETYPWFAELNKDAPGLDSLDEVFDLTPEEVEESVDRHLDIIIKSKNKSGVNEFKVVDENHFEHVDYERGKVSRHLCFDNRRSFIKHLCSDYVSMIPKYAASWPRRS
jgi:hypothetical protein